MDDLVYRQTRAQQGVKEALDVVRSSYNGPHREQILTHLDMSHGLITLGKEPINEPTTSSTTLRGDGRG